jgi:hypothetical protein
MSIFKTLAQRTAARARESWEILLLARAKPLVQVLSDVAPLQNQTAVSLLKLYKQANELRYYGIMGYIQHHKWFDFNFKSQSHNVTAHTPFNKTSTTSTCTDSTTTTTDTTKKTTARVAFMITSSMKQELIELDYDEPSIRKLTPVEASLILQHKIAPALQAEQLPRIVQEHEQQQQQQQQQQQAEISSPEPQPEGTVDEKDPMLSAAESEKESIRGAPEPEKEPLLIASEAPPEHPVDAEDKPIPGAQKGKRLWYEVVEIKDGTPTVVGLYTNTKEAEVGIETQRFFAERHGYSCIYEVRETQR